MNRTYQKVISAILAIFLLVSGMCLENTKADSYNLSSVSKQEASLSDSLGVEYGYVQSCAEEILGQQNISNIIGSVRNSNLKKDSKYSFVFLVVNESVHSLIHFNMTEHTIVSPEKHCENVILSYIHNQDGKK